MFSTPALTLQDLLLYLIGLQGTEEPTEALSCLGQKAFNSVSCPWTNLPRCGMAFTQLMSHSGYLFHRCKHKVRDAGSKKQDFNIPDSKPSFRTVADVHLPYTALYPRARARCPVS